MKRWLKDNWFAVAAVVVVVVISAVAQRIQSAQAAAAQAVEADFNGRQMPVDMVGPHTWWAPQSFPAGATVNGLVRSIKTVTSATYALLPTDDAINVASGTASTLQLPATLIPGKLYTVFHNNGTTATTITCLGGYSLNGAVSDTSLDAAADMMLISGTATGWVAGKSNH
jgi:hypothetical protein